MTKQEEKILDKYQKHCLNIRQKFSVKERKVLNRVFQRAIEIIIGIRGKNDKTRRKSLR